MTRTFVYDFEDPPAVSPAELRLLIGGKGANLAVMARDLGLPVPPGFTVTTEAYREYLAGSWPDGLDEELRYHMKRLGQQVGRTFGAPADPLLVSVRSGAPVSMPGMMDTILNLGLNEATAAGLAASGGGADFAADCLRRFRQGYRDVIGDVDAPDDPWMQLRNAVEAVFRSWNSDRARAYRHHEQISDELGTAVTVQTMVFGNTGPDSGTGVLFTRNPSTGESTLYGDIMFDAQGEDVVAGDQATEPLSALDARMPAVADELRGYANVLEHHLADLADIEFTIENGRLWLLQVRVGKRSPRAALRMAIDMAEDETFPLSREEAVRRVASYLTDPPREFVRKGDSPPPIAVGLPASPGVGSGAIVTSAEAAEAAADAGLAVILVRTETSPEDVAGMAKAAGVLTARGGFASHAAVVARGWGIPAVVGAASVVPAEGSVQIGDRTLKVGERITIDGSTGEIHLGELAGSWEVAPEAATLLGWAAGLGIDLNDSGAKATNDGATHAVATHAVAPDRAPDEAPLGDPEADDVARLLLVKGAVTLEQLSEALASSAERVQQHVDELASKALAEEAGGQIRLTAEGKLHATAGFAAERASTGMDEEQAARLLDEFHAVDARMKEIVTGWQIREVGGEQVINDHADAAYDAQVLDRLGELHSGTATWLTPLSTSLRQFAAYRTRLSKALELARGGDQRFMASPRVDSYHSVWFELHEHLIRLAGRRRSDLQEPTGESGV